MENTLLLDSFQESNYAEIKYRSITGRYVTNRDLEAALKDFDRSFKIDVPGRSVQDKPIYRLKLGSGKIRVLAWSQMHGNESTTTKALLDLLNTYKLKAGNQVVSSILNNICLWIVPVLNPDGAQAYTRVNANSVDLNRDMQQLSQPESQLLKKLYDKFQPDFCLNLHDQRTIFSAGDNKKSAILSFLTPSKDEKRSVDDSRKKSMSLIAGIADDLEMQLSGHIGRYDDAFNINCAGDTFQSLLTPTILFEGGHSPGDYEREETRKEVYRALLSCLFRISMGITDISAYQQYYSIPENKKLFNDVIVRRARLNEKLVDISIQFKEVLKAGEIDLVPVIEKIDAKISNFGHREIDAEEKRIMLPDNSVIAENVIVNKIILNGAELEVKHGDLSN